jgi:ABC-type Fe3+ transport system permease subunit
MRYDFRMTHKHTTEQKNDPVALRLLGFAVNLTLVHVAGAALFGLLEKGLHSVKGSLGNSSFKSAFRENLTNPVSVATSAVLASVVMIPPFLRSPVEGSVTEKCSEATFAEKIAAEDRSETTRVR